VNQKTKRILRALGCALVLASWFLAETPLTAAEAPVLDPRLLPAPASKSVDFSRDVKPVLERSCIKCHGAAKAKNGFRLDERSRALAGGDDGVDIVPEDSGKSRLVHFISRTVKDFEMPPPGKGDPLTAEEIGVIRRWIDDGAKWDGSSAAAVAAADDGTNWWSLQPLKVSSPPHPGPQFGRVRNPIDAFVVAKLEKNGLKQSHEASRTELVRRLYFDLLGLPPTPEEVRRFVRDRDPKAYEKLVDELLASPHYGERWARHWLDVVHFGETHGYDKDKPRPNAWPYRDYVIRAFNEDRPYSRFVREQIAGDVLFPGSRDGNEALGFISAGPWDFIGHAEVPESKIDGKVARHLDRDDMVVNTVQTFLSLTVQCAQCHHHKFDPISQEDYYSLQADFAALDRADRSYDVDPAVARRRGELIKRQAADELELNRLKEAIRGRAGPSLAELEKKIGALESAMHDGAAHGYHSQIESRDNVVKWVQVDLGKSVAISNVVLRPCRDDYNNIGEGFGFPIRFKVEAADDESLARNVRVITRQEDRDVPNPKLNPQTFEAGGLMARYIRVTATRLAPRMNDYIFALAELEVVTTNGLNAALGAKVSALDSIEAPVRWSKTNLTDGLYPGGGTNSVQLAELRSSEKKLIEITTTREEEERLSLLEHSVNESKTELSKLPRISLVYAGTVFAGSGAFSGTGGNGGKPRPIYILNRGNVQKPGREAGPGALSAVGNLAARFDLPAGHPEGERRVALARWLTDRGNPLTWRSIVNRVWQYHFGRGIVETPNDFGHMGALPSHPELLDWLAVEFRDGGESIKQLQRLIVTSATYRQACVGDSGAEKLDRDNRLLWRMNRRKLEAEEVRDAVLMMAGKLDLRLFGPSFEDFVIDKPEHSPHYEYGQHDPEDPKSHRRSIYRWTVRSQPDPYMAALDCADPSMQVARRNEGVSALQALAMLNDRLIIVMARDFAARLERENKGLQRQVARGFYEATGHEPDKEKLKAMTRYASQFGLPNLCRVLMNLNEFVFVD
jgi:mono/diheme cytochrome c family protein